MKVFVYTVEFLNAENESEYKTVKGVYTDMELAKNVLFSDMRKQSDMWEGSYMVKLDKAKEGLVSKDGFSKVYQVIEKEVNQ